MITKYTSATKLAQNGQITILIDHQTQSRGPSDEPGKYLGVMAVILDTIKMEKIPLMLGFDPCSSSSSSENIEQVREILQVVIFVRF